MSAGDELLGYRETRSFLDRSQGPRLAVEFAGFEHYSFSDAPVLQPGSTRGNLAVQRAYLRAFLDRYVFGRESRLLERPSARWPEASIRYRERCCGKAGS